MSLTTHHIISHSTGVSNPRTCTGAELFQIWFIHVTFCVSSFRMDLLVQNVHLSDPLPDWNSQGYRFTVSLYFEDGPLCRHRIRAKRVFFDNLVHFNFIIIRWILNPAWAHAPPTASGTCCGLGMCPVDTAAQPHPPVGLPKSCYRSCLVFGHCCTMGEACHTALS